MLCGATHRTAVGLASVQEDPRDCHGRHGDDLKRVEEWFADTHRTLLDFTFQCECVSAVTHGDIPIFEVIIPG